MKKTIYTLMAFTAFSSIIYAQTPDVKIGIKAGVNFANLTDGDMKTGFHVGGLAEIFINEKFSVQPEVVYSTQGSKTESSMMGVTVKAKQNLDYINVPIMAKYYVIEGFSVQAGPQVGFLMKSEIDIDSNVALLNQLNGDNKDQMNTIDFGVNFGLGYELPMGVFAEARYNLGLTKVPKEKEFGDYKNSVIQVSVGYKF